LAPSPSRNRLDHVAGGQLPQPRIQADILPDGGDAPGPPTPAGRSAPHEAAVGSLRKSKQQRLVGELQLVFLEHHGPPHVPDQAPQLGKPFAKLEGGSNDPVQVVPSVRYSPHRQGSHCYDESIGTRRPEQSHPQMVGTAAVIGV
jgi:hypothetical protein